MDVAFMTQFSLRMANLLERLRINITPTPFA
jgi:hypothetical protein